jgi:catechol 2,3-dioxygenase-like lactoylglutathione lyase family enzyme
MTSRLSHTTVDCHDPALLAAFWEQVLGFGEDPDDPNVDGDSEWWIQSADRSQCLLFIEVPDTDLPAKRIHFDLVPTDTTRDQEVARLLALGASRVADRLQPDGRGWVTLADPEGNQFCVLRSEAERAATA